MDKLILGSHVSYTSAEQLYGSVKSALSYSANTFMIYTGAPQNSMRSSINNELTTKAHTLMQENNIDIKNIVAHAPYIINLGGSGKTYDFSITFLKSEITRVESLGINKLVIHPGSHTGIGTIEGLKNIVKALNLVITPDMKVTLCLETMAGKGSELGSSFEEIKTIIDGIDYPDKIGVCLDTCHTNDAGYDYNDFDNILEQFDKIIGLDKLKVIHLNDSKNIKGAHKDRHENIGLGSIGFTNFLKIIYHDKLKDIPKILETPFVSINKEDGKKKEYPPYKFEIEMLKNQKFNSNLISDIIDYYSN